MSLIPFVLYDWEDPVCRSFLDRNLSLDLRRPKRFCRSPSLPVETINDYLNKISQRNSNLDQLRDMLDLATRHCESPRTFPVNKDDFQVVLDVQHFKPEEIEVKIVDDRLVVAAKHEDKKDDHGWVSRQFVRKYQLPKDINVERLTSNLSSDGLLTIMAPKMQSLKDNTEKTIQIEYTGKPFVSKTKEKPKTLQQSEEEKKKNPK